MGLDIWAWTRRKNIDPDGVAAELASAKSDNSRFDDNFIKMGEDTYFNITSEQVFIITYSEDGKRMTRKINFREREKIEENNPPTNT